MIKCLNRTSRKPGSLSVSVGHTNENRDDNDLFPFSFSCFSHHRDGKYSSGSYKNKTILE
jgi:hypothetical protein